MYIYRYVYILYSYHISTKHQPTTAFWFWSMHYEFLYVCKPWYLSLFLSLSLSLFSCSCILLFVFIWFFDVVPFQKRRSNKIFRYTVKVKYTLSQQKCWQKPTQHNTINLFLCYFMHVLLLSAIFALFFARKNIPKKIIGYWTILWVCFLFGYTSTENPNKKDETKMMNFVYASSIIWKIVFVIKLIPFCRWI